MFHSVVSLDEEGESFIPILGLMLSLGQIIHQHPIESLHHSIALRAEGGSPERLDSIRLTQGLEESVDELPSFVRLYDLWGPMRDEDVCPQGLSYFLGRLCPQRDRSG